MIGSLPGIREGVEGGRVGEGIRMHERMRRGVRVYNKRQCMRVREGVLYRLNKMLPLSPTTRDDKLVSRFAISATVGETNSSRPVSS